MPRGKRKNRLAIGKVKKLEVQDGLKELDPEQLGKLEEFLARADLSNLMRRQPVCASSQSNHDVFKLIYQ